MGVGVVGVGVVSTPPLGADVVGMMPSPSGVDVVGPPLGVGVMSPPLGVGVVSPPSGMDVVAAVVVVPSAVGVGVTVEVGLVEVSVVVVGMIREAV